MALDQKVIPSVPQMNPPDSAIENEIPTYRAISPLAVVALLFGVLAVFSVAHLSFLAFAVLAVAVGALADRKIQRMPDVLTGRRLAHAGVALGLIFGLGMVTMTLVQGQLRQVAATRFARRFVDVIRNGTVADAYWYKHAPSFRKGKTPDQLLAEITKGARDQYQMQTELGGYKAIKKRLDSSKDETIRFEKIEKHGTDGLHSWAAALLEIRGPGTKETPEKEVHALLHIKGAPENGKMEWWIDNLIYPYNPDTFSAPDQPVDDGHGHGHSH